MSQCIVCKQIIAGEPYHVHVDEEYGDKWVWCSMQCLMLDKDMTDCETCGAPLVVEDAMISGLYVLRGFDLLSAEPVHYCSTNCLKRAE